MFMLLTRNLIILCPLHLILLNNPDTASRKTVNLLLPLTEYVFLQIYATFNLYLTEKRTGFGVDNISFHKLNKLVLYAYLFGNVLNNLKI